MADKKTVKVTLIKSTIGRQPKHIETVKGLGLRRIRHTVELEDDQQGKLLVKGRGVINAFRYFKACRRFS